MHNRRIVVCVFLHVLLFSCRKQPSESNPLRGEEQIEIILFSKTEGNFYFDERYTDFPIYSLKKRDSNNYAQKLKMFKGIPKFDSFSIVSNDLFLEPKVLTKSIMRHEINAISGFLGNEQIVLLDSDNDYDFSDEKTLKFENNFRVNHNIFPNLLTKVSLLDYNYQTLDNDMVYEIHRKIQVFPYTNHSHTYLFDEELDSLLNKYTLMLRLKDYREGNFELKGQNYSVGLQGLNKENIVIVIKPDSISYDKTDVLTQQNFQYKVSDTIKLSGLFYRIDSTNNIMSKLFLKKLAIKDGQTYSNRIGDTISNFKLNSITGDTVALSNLIKDNKRFMLLDFWGTWCAPCKEITPKLKEFNKSYSQQLNIVSIAYDENETEVIKYVKENNMDWFHAYVKIGEREGSMLSALGIVGYPTLILLDHNRKIVYRGGPSSIEEIKKKLEKQ